MAQDETAAGGEHAADDRRLAALIDGYRASAVIGAFARLGIADALAEGPCAIGELARRVGADERSLSRLLDATLELDLVTVEGGGRYRLGVLGERLRSDVQGSLRRFAVVSTEEWRWAAYGHLDHALRTGEPGFVAAHGRVFWDYLAAHPEAAASFAGSMARIGGVRDAAVAAAVDLSGVSRVVDVGGGSGGLVCALLARDERLSGVVVDRPEVVEEARGRLRAAGLVGRSEALAGDFRELVPAGGDAYFLSWILHDWDDATALRILRVCRAAAGPGSRLFLVELVVPEPGAPGAPAVERLVRQTDLEMLAVVGGRERTAAEYGRLLSDARFRLDRVVPLEGLPWSVLEGSAVTAG